MVESTPRVKLVRYGANHLKASAPNDPRMKSDGYRQNHNFTKIRLLHDSWDAALGTSCFVLLYKRELREDT